jgi:Tol biopolymer transport system component
MAFTAYQPEQDLYGLHVINKDGSPLSSLFRHTQQIKTPHWSPGGTKIAYEVQGNIFLVNADGSEIIQLTQGVERDYYPVWSPDGVWIAYYSQEEGDRPGLHLMDGDGRNQRVVLDKYATGDALNDLHWSPDSKYITVRSGQKVVVVDVIQGVILAEIEQAFALAWMP